MKLCYKLLQISCIFMFFTLTLSVILTFYAEQNALIQFINSISLNIFAGAIILFFTSLVEYFVNRRKNLENIMKYILKYRNYFSKIEYLDKTDCLTYEEYKNKLKKKDNTLEQMLKLHEECDKHNKKKLHNLDDIIEAYLNIANINFNDFWSLYDDMRFIFKNKKNKLKLHREIFKRIFDEAYNIRELSYHLNIYKTKGASPVVMYEKIRKYQNNIFYEKTIPNDEKLDEENMKRIKNGIAYSIACTENTAIFRYNKFTDYLDNKYVEIGRMAYFNKKYTGYED